MNPYLKIAFAAVVASYITPPMANKLARPEMDGHDAIMNLLTELGLTAAGTAAIFYALSTVTKAAPAGAA